MPWTSLGLLVAFCRQLETPDAYAVPGDAAESVRGLENEIALRRLIHRTPLCVSICQGNRKANTGIQPLPASHGRKALFYGVPAPRANQRSASRLSVIRHRA